MSNTTRWYRGTMGGAATLDTSHGSLVTLLDAVLSTGFGTVTASSLAVSSEVATLTVDTGHGFLDQQVIAIAGATPAGLNGEWRVTVVSSTVVTFAAPGLSDGAATGTITAKTPPIPSWEKRFADTNRAAYRSTAIDASGMHLYIDDTGSADANGRWAAARCYGDMTDIDTGADPFPTPAQQAIWGIPKSLQSGAPAHDWIVVGDHRFVWLLIRAITTASVHSAAYIALCCGDGIVIDPADAGAMTTLSSNPTHGRPDVMSAAPRNAGGACGYMAVTYNGVASPVQYSHMCANYHGGANLGQSPDAGYPASIGGSISADPVMFYETSSKSAGIRGLVPGLYAPMGCPGDGSGPFFVSGIGADPARQYLLVHIGSATANEGYMVIDLSGPWR